MYMVAAAEHCNAVVPFARIEIHPLCHKIVGNGRTVALLILSVVHIKGNFSFAKQLGAGILKALGRFIQRSVLQLLKDTEYVSVLSRPALRRGT